VPTAWCVWWWEQAQQEAAHASTLAAALREQVEGMQRQREALLGQLGQAVEALHRGLEDGADAGDPAGQLGARGEPAESVEAAVLELKVGPCRGGQLGALSPCAVAIPLNA
jgi:hypothetical protein